MMGIEGLAAEIQTRERPIAVLAGSGVSHSAGLPTGQDMLVRIAREIEADPGDDPVGWYLRHTGSFPDYFGLLDDGTGAEALPGWMFAGRTATRAQRAIAELAADGQVGPILTTNLDRLLEQALHEAGVPFDVAYDLAAMARIGIGGQVLIKLHGDYKDIGVRHTAPEPHTYHRVIDDLLDRIFAGFDLLVCGWSASWDLPLGRALRRAGGAEGKRIFWLQCGPPAPAAQEIWAVRQASIAPVESSDAGLAALSGVLLGRALAPRYRPPRCPAPDSGSAHLA